MIKKLLFIWFVYTFGYAFGADKEISDLMDYFNKEKFRDLISFYLIMFVFLVLVIILWNVLNVNVFLGWLWSL